MSQPPTDTTPDPGIGPEVTLQPVQQPLGADGSTPRNADMNPAQQRVMSALRTEPETWPVFDADLGDALRAELEAQLAPLGDLIDSGALGEKQLFLSKYKLTQVLGCGVKFMAEQQEPFVWSPRIARGSVAHKAIELSMAWRDEPRPMELVAAASESLIRDGYGVGAYLQECSHAERAEIESAAGSSVAQFLECFPRLKASWKPVTEFRLRAELLDGRVVLSGRPDLTLGGPQPRTNSDAASGKVIIDLKTGGFSPTHREDMRFYALLETLRLMPPRHVATCYLDEGRVEVEAVTEDLLASALRRTADGAQRYAALIAGQASPVTSPGPACKWCPVQLDCEEGTAFLDGTPEDSSSW